MDDAAAARREARRKRILENSQNRLHLISGKSSAGSGTAAENRITSKPIEKDIDNLLTTEIESFCLPRANNANGALSVEPESFEWLSPRQDNFIGASERQGDNDFAALGPQTQEPFKKLSFWGKLVTNKYDVVLLASIVHLLYSLSLIKFDDAYFFLPLAIYTVTKLSYFPLSSQSSFANILLLMNGMSPSRVKTLLKFSQWATTLSRDVCVYLFTIICIQSLSDVVSHLVT